MKTTWSFPALVRGIPSNPKEERLCLVSKHEEFEVKELDLTSMPLVMTATLHYQEEIVEYRLHNDQLYKSLETDYDVLWVERDCMDTLAYGPTQVYREIADEIVDIMKSGTVKPWPKNAHAKRQHGARNLEKSGVQLLPEGEIDLAFWRERFQHKLDEFILAGGKTWIRTAEPVWSVNLQKQHAILDHASCFSDKRDECGERHYATDENAARIRVFSMQDFDAMTSALDPTEVEQDDLSRGVLDKVEIFLPEAFKLDVDRLEMDRLARAVAGQVGKALSQVKPGGGQTLLQVAPTSLIVAWGELRDLVNAYNPLEGVPDELEHKLSDFIAEADGMEAVYGPTLLTPAFRDAIEYAGSRWENRAIDISAAPLFAAK